LLFHCQQARARDFTPWLANEDNIEILAETLGIEIEVENTEVSVGSFKADIVAKELNTNRTIIIENQLEKTNHTHLGQIITYASGLEANIIIWVCDKVTEEHRNAIDWLNEITQEEISFFAVEIELWKINDSLPAPKFNIICRPNDWAKTIKSSSTTSNELTNTKMLQLKFWNALKEYMVEHNTFLKLQTPRAQHWYLISIGRSKFSISLTVHTRNSKIASEIYIRGEDAKNAFSQLIAQKNEIEKEFGGALDWQELPEGQDCRIRVVSDGNIANESAWNKCFEWFQITSEKLHRVFSIKIKNLKL
jgi:hypothetical protein